MIPLIPIALSLATKFAPSLIGGLFGKESESIANTIVNTASLLTGEKDPNNLDAAMQRNPEAVLKFQSAMAQIELEKERENSARHAEYNSTLRGDVNSTDWFTSRWRPFYGYTLAICMFLLFITVCVSFMIGIFSQDVTVTEISEGMSKMINALWPIVGVGLSVLGYYVKKRSDDKKVSVGDSNGIINTIAGIIKK